MKFETIIEECKPKMYSIFNQYNVDGYDSDDLFQETVVWILRDWKKITKMHESDECPIEASIVKLSRWACNHLKFYNPDINRVPVTNIPEEADHEEFTELDMVHLFIRAKKKLSKNAFDVFYTKMRPTLEIRKIIKKDIPTRRDVQRHLSLTDRPYQTAMKEIREFLNDEGICSNRR